MGPAVSFTLVDLLPSTPYEDVQCVHIRSSVWTIGGKLAAIKYPYQAISGNGRWDPSKVGTGHPICPTQLIRKVQMIAAVTITYPMVVHLVAILKFRDVSGHCTAYPGVPRLIPSGSY